MTDRYEHVPNLTKQGLYDPRFEHDACGVGLVASVKGVKSHEEGGVRDYSISTKGFSGSNGKVEKLHVARAIAGRVGARGGTRGGSRHRRIPHGPDRPLASAVLKSD